MRMIIEEQELRETLWDEGSEETTFIVPDGIRRLCPYCIDTYEKYQKVPVLQEIVIPASVEVIDADAFSNPWEDRRSPSLHRVHFRGTLKQWCAIEKGWHEGFQAYTDFGIMNYVLYLLDDDGREYPAEHLVIPADIPEIRGCSFVGCASLRTVDILGNVRISACAFASCSNLYRVRILGAASFNDLSDIYEPGDQSPFDERADLEIVLSDEAAESLIQSEYYSLKDTPLRICLMDREETLGEILEAVEYLQEEYHYKYGTPIGQDVIRTYRSFLQIFRGEQKTESDSYDDESDAEGKTGEETGEEDSALLLPGGYHYDDRMTLRARVFHWLIVSYRKIHEHQEGLQQLAAELEEIRTINEVPGLLRHLTDLDPLSEEAADLRDEIDECAEELIGRGVLDVSDTLYEGISHLVVILEETYRLEEELGDSHAEYLSKDLFEQAHLWDQFLDECRTSVQMLRECCDDAKKEIWELLQAE